MKLYEVSMTVTAYVMAKDDADAQRAGWQALGEASTDHHDPETCQEVTHRDWPIDAAWEPECLVYGTEEDTTLGSVLANLPKREGKP